MSLLVDKIEEELSKLYEKITVDPSDDDTVVKLKVDDSDDSNMSENQNPFSQVHAIKVEVEIEEDEDAPDSPYIDNLKEAIKKRKIKTR